MHDTGPIETQQAAHARAAPDAPVAVVDIGSNTVRLVVYDGYRRAPVPMFNEGAACGLGAELAGSGEIGADAAGRALRAIARFGALARGMGAEEPAFIATAAVREARNGAEFVRAVAERCGERVAVLSGDEEARLSALGVISGLPGADGIMGDLGGGSLELVDIRNGRIARQATLPLGILRHAGRGRAARRAMLEEIRAQLAELRWLKGGAGRAFYPVGGAWRSVARLHMARADHPLHVIDGYRMSVGEMRDLAEVMGALGPRSLEQIAGVSRRRRDGLPIACDTIRALLAATRAKKLAFSAQGLREGFLYDRLAPERRGEDPVLAAAMTLAARESRFGPVGGTLFDWIEPLFQGRRKGGRRLRRIACHLADIGWREHPDYRAVQTMNRIQRFPFMGLEHDQRGFLSYAAFVRYGGDPGAPEAQAAHRLMTQRQRHRAEVIGEAMRLAFRVSGGAPGPLARAALAIDRDRLTLALPDDGSMPLDEPLSRQLDALAAAAGMRPGRIVA
ncbi:MAG: Ppx/GppA family phosphatase [Defluviicoccus sp.]|nr:Ppx/GppA family phosphatase [Defluviicoccus sp.]MDE0383606.1 Ppx/GppA family phosphatase [Defluviicoccus sp.]